MKDHIISKLLFRFNHIQMSRHFLTLYRLTQSLLPFSSLDAESHSEHCTIQIWYFNILIEVQLFSGIFFSVCQTSSPPSVSLFLFAREHFIVFCFQQPTTTNKTKNGFNTNSNPTIQLLHQTRRCSWNRWSFPAKKIRSRNMLWCSHGWDQRTSCHS